MTGTETRSVTWTVAPVDVGSADALALLRDYFTEVSDRYFLLHFDRRSTPEEIETGLADSPSHYLALPTGCSCSPVTVRNRPAAPGCICCRRGSRS